jgi:hypothetical protein
MNEKINCVSVVERKTMYESIKNNVIVVKGTIKLFEKSLQLRSLLLFAPHSKVASSFKILFLKLF